MLNKPVVAHCVLKAFGKTNNETATVAATNYLQSKVWVDTSLQLS